VSNFAIYRRSPCVWTAGSSQNIIPIEEGKATGSGASGCGGVGEANFLPQ